MTFRRGGAGKRRDAVEPDVIKALKAIGVEVWQINGHGLPDLLCKLRGRWTPLGLKSGKKASLTPTEKAGKAPWPMAWDVPSALLAMEYWK